MSSPNGGEYCLRSSPSLTQFASKAISWARGRQSSPTVPAASRLDKQPCRNYCTKQAPVRAVTGCSYRRRRQPSSHPFTAFLEHTCLPLAGQPLRRSTQSTWGTADQLEADGHPVRSSCSGPPINRSILVHQWPLQSCVHSHIE